MEKTIRIMLTLAVIHAAVAWPCPRVDISLQGVIVYAARVCGDSECFEDLLQETAGCEECEDGNVCRGPFMLNYGGEREYIGYYCANPWTNNPIQSSCDEVTVLPVGAAPIAPVGGPIAPAGEEEEENGASMVGMCQTYFNLTLHGVTVFSALGCGENPCLEDQFPEGSQCMECDEPQVCRGPFMFNNGGEIEDIGNYCVDPETNNPIQERCEGLNVVVFGAEVDFVSPQIGGVAVPVTLTCPSYFNVTLDGEMVYYAEGCGRSICLDETFVQGMICEEGCEAPEICQGPFMLDNNVTMVNVGYYCVDPATNNPMAEGCEDVTQIYPELPTEAPPVSEAPEAPEGSEAPEFDVVVTEVTAANATEVDETTVAMTTTTTKPQCTPLQVTQGTNVVEDFCFSAPACASIVAKGFMETCLYGEVRFCDNGRLCGGLFTVIENGIVSEPSGYCVDPVTFSPVHLPGWFWC